MRQSAARRFVYAFLFALAAAALVAFWNPVDHIKADLRADSQGIRLSLEVAARAIESTAERL